MKVFRKFLKSLKKNFQARKSFIVPYQVKKNINKEYDHVLKAWNKFEMKKMKEYHDLYLKCDVLLFADVFEIFRNNRIGLLNRTRHKLGCNA